MGLVKQLLESINTTLFIEIDEYTDRGPEGHCCIFAEDIVTTKKKRLGDWQLNYDCSNFKGVDAYCLNIGAECVTKDSNRVDATVSVGFDIAKWSNDNYVFIPAAVYAGNRFSIKEDLVYPPMLEECDLGVNVPAYITNVPHLSSDAKDSRFQLLTRDAATPCLGVFFPELKKMVFFFLDVASELGDTGIDFSESRKDGTAKVKFTAPGLREKRYSSCNKWFDSDDTPASFRYGDKVHMNLRIICSDANDLKDFYETYIDSRKALTKVDEFYNSLPMGAAFKVIESKYNRSNWYDEGGFYSPIIKDAKNPYPWRIGWCGGLMSTYAFLVLGTRESKERALKTFEYVFPDGVSRTGLFYDISDGKSDWRGGLPERSQSVNWHFVRRGGDALYFTLKQFDFLLENGMLDEVSEDAIEGVEKCADAFVGIWDKYKQFGQFVDLYSGNIVIGGSSAGAIVPAALACASLFYSKDRYLEVAKDSACKYYNDFLKTGVTTGGPAEILQCPDSESAFALLESLVVLYEITNDNIWIDRAKVIANYCSSWCTSYNYRFPDDTTFGKLNMHSLGTVWANVQNKHASPGICSLSGDSLFKLFRATGDVRYLNLIMDIAHSITEYVSRDDRVIGGMPSGWVNERVNLSDWAEGTGEIFYGSCWPETSCLLSYLEIPGIYVQLDQKRIYVIDHVDAILREEPDGELAVVITNRSNHDTTVRIFIENSSNMSNVLRNSLAFNMDEIAVSSNSSKIFRINKF